MQNNLDEGRLFFSNGCREDKSPYKTGWKYTMNPDERHFTSSNLGATVKNVKKNRKKKDDNLWYREQNIYTNYTAPLVSGYIPKNNYDRLYTNDDTFATTIKQEISNEFDNLVTDEANRRLRLNSSKYRTKPIATAQYEIKQEVIADFKKYPKLMQEIEQKNTGIKNICEKIKKKPKFNIDKDTQHLNDYFFNHGSENRELIMGMDNYDLVDYALLSHFYQIPNEQFEKLESFYFKSMCCYGGYFDNQTNIFDEIQHKLKSINGTKKPKCFVRLLKKEYSGYLNQEYDKDEYWLQSHFKFLPLKKSHPSGDDFPTLDDIYDNPDNYFDYYYVEEDKIYKVSHDLVHNRKELIDNDLVREEAIKADKEYNSKIENEADRLNFDPFINTKSFKDALQEDINDTKTGLIEKKDLCEEFYKKIKNSVALRNEFYKYMQDHPL